MSIHNFAMSSVAGSSAQGGGFYPYLIDQSLRFDGTSSYLNFTPSSSTAGTFTVSFWVKRTKLGVAEYIFYSGAVNQRGGFGFDANDEFFIGPFNSSGANANLFSDMKFRDVGSWYHIVVEANAITYSNLATAMNIYVNGQKITTRKTQLSTPSGGDRINDTQVKFIGALTPSPSQYTPSYLSEWHWVDGTALNHTNFGETINGIWVPKEYTGSHGSAGYYLPFDDSSAIGDDKSANTNDWTANNLSAHDIVPDSPTNNFATLNSVGKVYGAANVATFSEGNLKSVTGTYPTANISTFAIQPNDTTGYYWEVKADLVDPARSYMGIIDPAEKDLSGNGTSYGWPNKYILSANGDFYGSTATNGSGTVSQTSYTNGDILMFAYKEGKIWIGKNGTWMNSGDPAAGTGNLLGSDGSTPSDRGDVTWYPYAGYNLDVTANFGQDSTFAGATTAGGNTDGNGIGDFKYTVPSGFLALCNSNLPEPSIGPNSVTQSDDYFETMLYTGNGGIQHIGSDGVQHPIDVTTISNSLRFNDDDSPYLHRTISSAGNRKTWTWSGWVKRGNTGLAHMFFGGGTTIGSGTPDHNATSIRFNSDGSILVFSNDSDSASLNLTTNRQFYNVSEWMHILVAFDTTQSTASDRIKLYVDGAQITSFSTETYPSLNYDTHINENSIVQIIGAKLGPNPEYFYDGEITEIYFVDGQALTPSSFGQYGSNGYWIPKAVSGLTYGTNGFYLDFADNSSASALGTDDSGNSNNWTPVNFVVSDQILDTPTKNYMVMSSLDKSSQTLSEGNLRVVGAADYTGGRGTVAIPSTGKWYFEARVFTPGGGAAYDLGIGIGGRNIPLSGTSPYPQGATPLLRYFNNAIGKNGTTTQSGVTQLTAGTILGIAIDVDNNSVQFYINGVAEGSAETLPALDEPLYPVVITTTTRSAMLNFGQDSTFAGQISAGGNADANGDGDFAYAPPTDHLALVDDNYPVEGLTVPDFVWIKKRSATGNHQLFDTIRGATNRLNSSTTNAEASFQNTLQSFDYQGFTVGGDGDTGGSGQTYAAWTWKAGGTAVSNTDGTITSQVSANTTAGFSIVTYTGSTSESVGHGLGVAPKAIFVKDRDATSSWAVYHQGIQDTTANGFMELNTISAVQTGSNPRFLSGTAGTSQPTNTVFYVNNYSGSTTNNTGNDYIAYCFAEIEGFSKFGSYIGNGNADGPFIYTGFRPAWIMWKSSTQSSSGWYIVDTRRNPYNEASGADLYAQGTEAEPASGSGNMIDINSNGFKHRSNRLYINGNGASYIYMAFAESPFKYSNAR